MDRRKILMDHFLQPEHKGLVANDQFYQKLLRSPACSDEMTLQIETDGQRLTKIHFDGQACVIATSSSDILFSLLEGKTFNEAITLIEGYEQMIYDGSILDETFGELVIFDNVHRQKGRWKCATLTSEGIKDFIKQEKQS